MLSGVISRSKELKIPRSLRACRFKSGPGDQKLLDKNNTFTAGILTVTVKLDLKRFDSPLTLNNLTDHRHRLAFIHRGCANDVVHHPGERCSYR